MPHGEHIKELSQTNFPSFCKCLSAVSVFLCLMAVNEWFLPQSVVKVNGSPVVLAFVLKQEDSVQRQRNLVVYASSGSSLTALCASGMQQLIVPR